MIHDIYKYIIEFCAESDYAAEKKKVKINNISRILMTYSLVYHLCFDINFITSIRMLSSGSQMVRQTSKQSETTFSEHGTTGGSTNN